LFASLSKEGSCIYSFIILLIRKNGEKTSFFAYFIYPLTCPRPEISGLPACRQAGGEARLVVLMAGGINKFYG